MKGRLVLILLAAFVFAFVVPFFAAYYLPNKWLDFHSMILWGHPAETLTFAQKKAVVLVILTGTLVTLFMAWFCFQILRLMRKEKTSKTETR